MDCDSKLLSEAYVSEIRKVKRPDFRPLTVSRKTVRLHFSTGFEKRTDDFEEAEVADVCEDAFDRLTKLARYYKCDTGGSYENEEYWGTGIFVNFTGQEANLQKLFKRLGTLKFPLLETDEDEFLEQLWDEDQT